VVDELKHLVATYPKIKSFCFHDDDFSANKDRVIDLCRRLVAEGLQHCHWHCSCRVDQVDREMLDWMKRAGCVKIGYGLESADPEVLRRLNKKIDLATVSTVIDLTAQVGIDSLVYLIVGNPGETPATLRTTYHVVKKLNCPAMSWGIMQVLPGTALAKLQPQKDFVSYVYEPEVVHPNPIINANIPAYENPGMDREEMKRFQKIYSRKIILYKMMHHPVYAAKKLFWMPLPAIKHFAWILGLSREP